MNRLFNVLTLFVVATHVPVFATTPSIVTTDTACEADWKQNLYDFLVARKNWKDTGCYQYSIQKKGFIIPEDPIRVTVVNGKVVAPVDANGKPTQSKMESLFLNIRSECFAQCPEVGPRTCDATYNATEGYITSFFVNPSDSPADAGHGYEITGFKRCGGGCSI